MSPASYRAAPPRVAQTTIEGAPTTNQIGVALEEFGASSLVLRFGVNDDAPNSRAVSRRRRPSHHPSRRRRPRHHPSRRPRPSHPPPRPPPPTHPASRRPPRRASAAWPASGGQPPQASPPGQ